MSTNTVRYIRQGGEMRTEHDAALIYLLKKEIACLRSVLSEWDDDKDCYLQWNRAEAIRVVLENMGE